MASETDWLGNKVTFSHDGDGDLTTQDNEVSTSNPNGTSGTSYSYDAADDNSSATSTVAGTNCNLVQSFSGSPGSRNADGQVTEDYESFNGGSSCWGGTVSIEHNYSYDAAGRVVYEGSSSQGANPNNFAYNPAGVLTTISTYTNQGANWNTYTQTVNNSEQVTAQKLNGNTTTSYGYDSMGDLTSAAGSSNTASYGYDSIGQMTSLSNSGSGTTSNYEYTGDGLEAAAVSSAGFAPPDLTWGQPQDIDKTIGIWSISCVNGSPFCVAVDNNGNAAYYGLNGTQTWSRQTGIDPGSIDITAVSCVAGNWCMAVDAEGRYLIYEGGTTWTTAAPITGESHQPTAISCISSTWCVVADTNGDVYWWNGTTWQLNKHVDPGEPLYSISCTGPSFCAAVGYDGKGFIFTGYSNWTTSPNTDGHSLFSVSCFGSSFCAAVDSAGGSFIWNGTTWTRYSVDGSHSIDSISCDSTTYCLAVDGVGNALAGNPTTFATKTDIDSSNELTGVSLTGAPFGAAVDADGNGIVGAESEQLIWDSGPSTPLVLADGTNYYIYGPDQEPVEQVNVTSAPPANNPVFLTYTPADSSWLTTNTAGTVLAWWRYDAFGNLAFGAPDSPFGFAGQYSDSAPISTGFDNMRARWYQPQMGQFTTVDPDFAGTDQAYAYAGDDPTDLSDPLGTDTMGFCVNEDIGSAPRGYLAARTVAECLVADTAGNIAWASIRYSGRNVTYPPQNPFVTGDHMQIALWNNNDRLFTWSSAYASVNDLKCTNCTEHVSGLTNLRASIGKAGAQSILTSDSPAGVPVGTVNGQTGPVDVYINPFDYATSGVGQMYAGYSADILMGTTFFMYSEGHDVPYFAPVLTALWKADGGGGSLFNAYWSLAEPGFDYALYEGHPPFVRSWSAWEAAFCVGGSWCNVWTNSWGGWFQDAEE